MILMCILNGFAIKKYLHYRQEFKRTFMVPAICAAVMGGAVYGIYQLLITTVKINAIATLVMTAFLTGMFIRLMPCRIPLLSVDSE